MNTSLEMSVETSTTSMKNMTANQFLDKIILDSNRASDCCATIRSLAQDPCASLGKVFALTLIVEQITALRKSFEAKAVERIKPTDEEIRMCYLLLVIEHELNYEEQISELFQKFDDVVKKILEEDIYPYSMN
jgi:hypothetical protein